MNTDLGVARNSRLKKTALFLSSSLARAGGQGLAAFLVARSLGSSEWGQVAILQVAIILSTEVTASGCYVGRLREQAEGESNSRLGSWPLNIFLLGLLAGVFAALATMLVKGPGSTTVWLMFMVSMMFSMSSATSRVLTADLVSVGRISPIVVTESVRSALTLSAGVIFVALELPSAEYWLVLLGGVSCVYLVFLVGARRKLSLGSMRSSAQRSEARNIAGLLSLGLGSAATIVLRSGDQVMLAWLGDLSSVGIYAMATRFVDVGVLLVAARSKVDHRSLSTTKSTAELVSRSFVSARRVGLLGLGASGVVFLAATIAARFLGDSFEGFWGVSLLLSVGICVRGAFLPLSFALMIGERATIRNAVLLGATLLNLGLNLGLIPRFGAIGASWATLAADSIAVAVFSGVLVVWRRRSVEDVATGFVAALHTPNLKPQH